MMYKVMQLRHIAGCIDGETDIDNEFDLPFIIPVVHIIHFTLKSPLFVVIHRH